MTEKPSNGVLAELRALAREVSENHEWLDADELEDDEAFARLVELLSNTDRVPAKDFADGAHRDGSKYLRAGTLAAIAAGRAAPPDWTERAKKRFQRADYGERQLLLRALALSEGKAVPRHPRRSGRGAGAAVRWRQSNRRVSGRARRAR